MSAGLAIYDTMQFVKPDVSTICIGQAASMGAVLLAAGATGKRFCLPHARVMIHQPLGGFQGQAADMEIHAKEMLETRDRLNKILAKHTGQSVERIKQDTDRDRFMDWNEAVNYGLIDRVLEKRGEVIAAPPVPDTRAGQALKQSAALRQCALEAQYDSRSKSTRTVKAVIQVPLAQRVSGARLLCFVGATPCYKTCACLCEPRAMRTFDE